MAIERFLKVYQSAPVDSLEHATLPALVSLSSRGSTLQVHALNSWSLKRPNFWKKSKVRGHGDWAIFEGLSKCSCCLTGTLYTASTGIVVFNGTHSTSPCTKLMKLETSKFLKKIKGPGSWRLSDFWRFIKVLLLTHWNTLRCQHWYRCLHGDPLYKSMH